MAPSETGSPMRAILIGVATATIVAIVATVVQVLITGRSHAAISGGLAGAAAAGAVLTTMRRQR